MEDRDESFPYHQGRPPRTGSGVQPPVHMRSGDLPARPQPDRRLSLDDLAFEAWKIILTRDYCGKHRDSPADAAQIAYEYAEAFVARRGQG